jgi:hypothetical protein
VPAAKRETDWALDIYFVPYFAFAGFCPVAGIAKHQNPTAASTTLPVSCGSRDFGCRASFPPSVQKNSRESADVVLMPADPFDSYKLENLLDNA